MAWGAGFQGWWLLVMVGAVPARVEVDVIQSYIGWEIRLSEREGSAV